MDLEQLIISIFNKRPLWDQKNKKHHNRFVLDKLWEDVADEMNSTRTIVRTKWKTLRDTYRKEIKKFPDTQSVDDTSSWKYFESLSFLREQFDIGNLSNKEHQEETVYEDNENSGESELSNFIKVEPYEHLHPEEETIEQTYNLKRKLSTEEEIASPIIRFEENKVRIMERQDHKSRDEDECFFDSLLPHIKRLTPQNKMLLRIKMQELVYNFVYGK